MELLFLALFAASLIACVVTGASVVFALIFGYILFFSYGLIHGKSVKEMLRFSRNGIFTVKNVLLTLLLISMLTAIWFHCLYRILCFCHLYSFRDAAGVFSSVLSDLLPYGNLLWKRCHHRRNLYDYGQQYGYSSLSYRRRDPGRDFFRGPVFSGFHQCASCQ